MYVVALCYELSPEKVYLCDGFFFPIAISTPSGNCSTGDLRLVGGSDNLLQGTRESRVEICINNAWGTVCDNLFADIDASVACYHLGGFSWQGMCV